MKLNDYILTLIKLQQKHGNLDVIYSTDDEGNSFGHVGFLPHSMKKEDLEGIFNSENVPEKAICVN